MNSALTVDGFVDQARLSTTNEQSHLPAPDGRVTRGWRAPSRAVSIVSPTTAGSTRPEDSRPGEGTPSPAARLGGAAASTDGVASGRPGDVEEEVGTTTT